MTADVRSDSSIKRTASTKQVCKLFDVLLREDPLEERGAVVCDSVSDGGWINCVKAIIPGRWSILSRTTVNRVFHRRSSSEGIDDLADTRFSSPSPAALLKLAPVAATRTRYWGGYRNVTNGVVMNVRTRASSTNIENTLYGT